MKQKLRKSTLSLTISITIFREITAGTTNTNRQCLTSDKYNTITYSSTHKAYLPSIQTCFLFLVGSCEWDSMASWTSSDEEPQPKSVVPPPNGWKERTFRTQTGRSGRNLNGFMMQHLYLNKC